MPDRYGDLPESPNPFSSLFRDDATTEYEQSASRQAERILAGAAVARCVLCDSNGYIGGTVCDHVDHRGAAKRGMAMVKPILDEIERKRRGGRHQTARPAGPTSARSAETPSVDRQGTA